MLKHVKEIKNKEKVLSMFDMGNIECYIKEIDGEYFLTTEIENKILLSSPELENYEYDTIYIVNNKKKENNLEVIADTFSGKEIIYIFK